MDSDGMMTAGFYAVDGELLLYGATAVWLPDGMVLYANDPPAESIQGWKWFPSEYDARAAYGLPEPVVEDNQYLMP